MTDNTFKPHTFVLKEDGKLYYVPDVPKVVRPCSDHTVITCGSYNRAVEKKALQSAIANDIEVENDENYRRVIERIKWSIYVENSGFKQPKGFLEIVDTISVDEGKLYPLNCRVEVIEEWIPGQGYNSPSKVIARVTFDEQPEILCNGECQPTLLKYDPKCPMHGADVADKPILNEVFTDNGEHSHWNLIDPKTGKNLWSEDPEEDAALGHPVSQPEAAGLDEQPEKKDHCWCAETCCASLPNCRFVDPEAAGQEQNKTAEEVVADHFEWHQYVDGPVMCYANDCVAIANSYASQQTASLQKQVLRLRSENAAANKRIEELTTKNLKLLNENNDLWDKVNNPKMKV